MENTSFCVKCQKSTQTHCKLQCFWRSAAQSCRNLHLFSLCVLFFHLKHLLHAYWPHVLAEPFRHLFSSLHIRCGQPNLILALMLYSVVWVAPSYETWWIHVHDITLRYTTLRCITLRYITPHHSLPVFLGDSSCCSLRYVCFSFARSPLIIQDCLGHVWEPTFCPLFAEIPTASIFIFHLSVQTWCLGGCYPRRTSDLHFACDLHFDKFDFPGELAHCTNCRHDEGVGLEPPHNSSTCSGHAETQTSQTSQTSSRLFLVV